MLRDKKGQSAAFAAVIPLVLIFGVAIVIAVLMSTIAASVFVSTESSRSVRDYNSLLDNTASRVGNDVNSAIENSFEAYNQATSNLDLLAIIAVASAVLMGIGGFFFASRNAAGSGGAL